MKLVNYSSKSINSVISDISNARANFSKCSKLINVRLPLIISLIVDSLTPDNSDNFFWVNPRSSYFTITLATCCMI